MIRVDRRNVRRACETRATLLSTFLSNAAARVLESSAREGYYFALVA